MPVVAGDLPPKARPLHTCAGSPVHTGIDPLTKTPDINPSWFPRAYGDRPISKRGENDLTRVPPCIRGSTCLQVQAASHLTGSPVHTGIGPYSCTPDSFYKRFPRAYGDRPPPSHGLPPKASCLQVQAASHLTGSPVHTGIRPKSRKIMGRKVKVPPYTRGST
jgi:hypothetical protein